MLISVTKVRFNPETKQLDLSFLSDDESYSSLEVDFNSPKFVGLLLSALKVQARQTQELNLEGNSISNLLNFESLGKILPNLRTLSLKDNCIGLLVLSFLF